MTRKLTTAQPTFRILVANLAGGSDPSKGPSGNPVKIRSQFEMQHFPEIPGRGLERGPVEDLKTPGITTKVGLLTGHGVPWSPVHSTGSVTVDSNNFAAPARLLLGGYSLVSGQHFTVAGNVNDTATNLAAAISTLSGFSAVAALGVVTITGPVGPDGNSIQFEALYEGSIQNYTLSPDDGSLDQAEPYIGPVSIT